MKAKLLCWTLITVPSFRAAFSFTLVTPIIERAVRNNAFTSRMVLKVSSSLDRGEIEAPPAKNTVKKRLDTGIAIAAGCSLLVLLAVSHAPHTISGGASDAHITAALKHFHPLKSALAGTGAGLTRAISRLMTFPLDTVKSREQLSRMSPEQMAKMSPEVRALAEKPSSKSGLFNGLGPFLLQAGPSNAAFFVTYDGFNTLFAAFLPGLDTNLVHLITSSLATIPTNLIRIPSEIIKQRLQVGKETGGSLAALKSIISKEGVKGLFVGGGAQLAREIPFNAIQFVAYDFSRSFFLGRESLDLFEDAAIGAVSSGFSALCTQPIDTVKTRVMTKTVPGGEAGGPLSLYYNMIKVWKAEGISSLYLGTVPRFLLVFTGGFFYFAGSESMKMLFP